MNIIALWHLIAGIILLAVSLPLIKRKIPMNSFYGFRIDEAFKSERLWYDINAYGGRLFFKWALVIITTALIGVFLPEGYWLVYAFASLVVILSGLIISVCKTLKYADHLKSVDHNK